VHRLDAALDVVERADEKSKAVSSHRIPRNMDPA
jgi:hypothetical protein